MFMLELYRETVMGLQGLYGGARGVHSRRSWSPILPERFKLSCFYVYYCTKILFGAHF